MSAVATALWDEIDSALRTDAWAVLDYGSDASIHRFYIAAALRHCAALMLELDHAISAGLTFLVRSAQRAHLEAFLYALYLHFGGVTALDRLIADARKEVRTTRRAVIQFNRGLAASKRRASKRFAETEATNVEIRQWNDEHPDNQPRPEKPLPHVPVLPPVPHDVRRNLRARERLFATNEPKRLSVQQVVDSLTKLTLTTGIGRESFEPLYLMYRILSSIGPHPGIIVYDSYAAKTSPHSAFIRAIQTPRSDDLTSNFSGSSIWATAMLACHVLGSAGCKTPVADATVQAVEASLARDGEWVRTG